MKFNIKKFWHNLCFFVGLLIALCIPILCIGIVMYKNINQSFLLLYSVFILYCFFYFIAHLEDEFELKLKEVKP